MVQRIYGEVLQALAKSKQARQAVRVLEEMKSLDGERHHTYTGPALCLPVGRRQGRLIWLWMWYCWTGLEPSGLCLARAMAACSRGGDAGAAQRIYRWMEDSQYLPRHAVRPPPSLPLPCAHGRCSLLTWTATYCLMGSRTLARCCRSTWRRAGGRRRRPWWRRSSCWPTTPTPPPTTGRTWASAARLQKQSTDGRAALLFLWGCAA